MDDVATAKTENENLRKIRNRLLQWEAQSNPLAALNAEQDEYLEIITNIWTEVNATKAEDKPIDKECSEEQPEPIEDDLIISSQSFKDLQKMTPPGIDNTTDFLLWYDRVHAEIDYNADATYHRYLKQLEMRSSECRQMLDQIDKAMEQLVTLSNEYAFVSEKTSALNTASEQLTAEQKKLQNLSDEIQRRLHYFNQVELLSQRLQSPTLSVASESFRECLDRIDECLEYLRTNPKFKDCSSFSAKYKHCLSKAITLVKNYTATVMTQATEATLKPTQQQQQQQQQIINASVQKDNKAFSSSDAAFVLYYGKYQISAVKIKRISQLIESRVQKSSEYDQLLSEMQQNYFTERASIMSPAVDKAIKELKLHHKTDHCTMMRSACAFLVHVCQDEQRLYYQFFSMNCEQLTLYLESLCTILYDTMRPFIIHINHLETLAEICSILRIEMLEEHVQQNPEPLEAFAQIVNQLLQDVQERLVFRAHLYLQSDISNFNPSLGDLAYPDKLEMMESIALSLQEPYMRRTDSRNSLSSTASTAHETESVDTAYRARNMNSPADLHGMWYPTVRRTLVCLSRLYRCVDRPIFQGLSQEALKLCIQSVSSAAGKISTAKTPIDGELFEIKHLLILREQIAPFRVDFTIKETSLDFSKVKTAAFGLLQKRKQLFTMGSNNALLEFLLEGTPQIKEHLLDSRKEVDRQLKTICEKFIKDAVQMLIGPLTVFLEKAQHVVSLTNDAKKKESNTTSSGGDNKEPQSKMEVTKINYGLRQSQWASPQVISGIIQESQRLIKRNLSSLQRSMQLYLSNRDTEFIIFRPIRNNIIQSFVKLEQLLTANGYSSDDMIITSCPSAEQVSILLSSANILATEGIANFSSNSQARKNSISSNEGGNVSERKSIEKKVSFDTTTTTMENVKEVAETSSTDTSAVPSPTHNFEKDGVEELTVKLKEPVEEKSNEITDK